MANEHSVSRLILRALLAGLLSGATISSAACARDQQKDVNGDIWLTKLPENFDFRRCARISRDLLVPVVDAKRQEALWMLERAAVVPISETVASTLLGPERSSATALIAAAIAHLERQQNLAISQNSGSWSGIEQMRLDELQALQARKVSLVPFLVRGLAGNEATGMFSATRCADDLLISHVSLGEPPAKPIRTPLVVFLDRAPAKIYSATGAAR